MTLHKLTTRTDKLWNLLPTGQLACGTTGIVSNNAICRWRFASIDTNHDFHGTLGTKAKLSGGPRIIKLVLLTGEFIIGKAELVRLTKARIPSKMWQYRFVTFGQWRIFKVDTWTA